MKNTTELANLYHQQYLESGNDYWESRGFNEQTIARFKLGLVVSPKTVDSVYFKGSPTIPYLTPDGYAYQIRVRSPKDGGPKYLPLVREHPGESKVHLFNARDSLESGVYITEGEIDCITLVQLGYPAVGVPGVSSWRSHWRYLLEDSEPTLILDPDEAGNQGREFIKRDLNCTEIHLEDLDLNDLLVHRGPESIHKLLGG